MLGKLQFEGQPLRDLLIEAIRYGDRPEVRARLTQVVENAVDRTHLQEPARRARPGARRDGRRAGCDSIREDMERAEARRLQPHYIESFFLEAFSRLGGTVRQREPRRYEITHVPAPVRNRDRLIGIARAGAAALRADRLREGADRAARASRWPPSSAPGIRCWTPSSTLRWSATATCCGAARSWWTSAIRARARACSSTSSTPSRTPASRARASGASSRSGCSTSRWMREGTTRHIALRALPRLPPACRGRAGHRGDSGPARVRLDQPGLEQKAQAYAIAHVVPEHLEEVRDRQARAGSPRPRPP